MEALTPACLRYAHLCQAIHSKGTTLRVPAWAQLPLTAVPTGAASLHAIPGLLQRYTGRPAFAPPLAAGFAATAGCGAFFMCLGGFAVMESGVFGLSAAYCTAPSRSQKL